MSDKRNNRYLVFNIGCIECGVSSNVVTCYNDREKAERACEALNEKLDWREGGQNHFQIFDLEESVAQEYIDVLGDELMP